jgi:outer membrane protein OmpA-like peptidoglycan-associated protein
MMHERRRYWIVVALALCTMLPLAARSEPGQAQRRELDRAESLLRGWLSDLPTDSGVALRRDSDRVSLSFSTGLIFEPDGTTLKSEAGKSIPLSAAARLLKRRRALSAQILVYTDNIGGDSANQSFSAARAKALGNWFTAQGIPAPRLHARGAGADDALSSNATPEGRSENRRVEIAFASLRSGPAKGP